eukprot:TRINITY_DN35307_c0_g1_i1.p1 TRINITY_DN35307_c0_g1~~TRINITY_DN35307_c0_g1_i1.p1  ORF type:complete len:106 (-),score=24.47 TRINITY_DN35307_c0_g1_i1:128-445(-)
MSMGLVFFFFFKQKTAYEMLRSLVGSEMCIRDRLLSSAASICLELISALPSDSLVVYVRGVLVALAQPTMSGVNILAVLLILGYGMNRVGAVSYTHLTLPTKRIV